MKQTFKFTMGRVAGITRVEQASDQNLVPPPPKPVTGKKIMAFSETNYIKCSRTQYKTLLFLVQ